MKMDSDTLHMTCFLYLAARHGLFHVPLNVLPMIFLMTPLIVHYLDTSVFKINFIFMGFEAVSDFSLLNSTAVNLCD